MKSLLVPATGGDGDRLVFETALHVAGTLGAHVEFLHVRTDVVGVMAAMLSGQADGPIGLDGMQDDLERDSATSEARARQAVDLLFAEHRLSPTAASPGGVSAEFSSVMGTVADVLIAHARTVDLTVMGREDMGDVLSEVLVECGRPVLFAPARSGTAAAALLDLAVIAWNDTAEAARAVTGAMPLLAQARAISIMTVGHADDPAVAASAERLAATLRRSVASVAVTVLHPDGRAAGDVLLESAQAAGAGLLVMGGFSHSRLRQLVFGGFTRDLLATATMPVLISH